ncbi:hypothetical protein GIY56_00790 [Paracoccus sp. YIM 132242]|uniref:Uncharacterized protein n=1 Tax=Paracoccus lichenicola TaxID=2665644 RepID=A0A6L6HKP1_9RHOB|nr:hypothetical protein [Paracoccus lichenicola]MTD98819.1 hypothetical protein [Paracoccus lichenicola]
MARGFWTGLLHGGVVSIAAVAALSLAAPVPRPEPAPVAQPAPRVAPVEPKPAAPVPQAGDAPQAGAVDLPVGSEFGRGGDMAPHLPAPLATERPDQPEAPAVMAPTSEPAPVAVTAADPRPQLAGERDGPVQGAPDAGEDAPQLDRPAALTLPTALAAPGRTVTDAPDAAPVVPQAEPAQASPAPGLPAPAPDLSLPPDLSDLRGLAPE